MNRHPVRLDVITLFPELFEPLLAHGITRRAFASGQVEWAFIGRGAGREGEVPEDVASAEQRPAARAGGPRRHRRQP